MGQTEGPDGRGGCGTTGVGFYERPGVDLWSCGLFKVETTPLLPPSPTKICCEIFYNFIFGLRGTLRIVGKKMRGERGGEGVVQLK